MHTVCPYVFSAAFIDRFGDVYACCHNGGRRYGNINDEPLSAILMGAEAERVRQMSRVGRLPCFGACNLLDYRLKHLDGPGPTTPTFPRIRKLTLSVGWLCNVACVMCPQEHRDRRALDPRVLESRIDWNAVDEIIVEGGEPLAMHATFELWDMLASAGRKLNVITNGLLIRSAVAERIVRHSDYVYISFNAASKSTYEAIVRGGRWERLLHNVTTLQDLRRERRSRLLIIGHMTITTQNVHEVADFVRFAAKHELDIANFGYNRLRFMGPVVEDYLRDRPDLHRALRRRVTEAVAACAPLRVDTSRLRYLNLIEPASPACQVTVWPSGM